MRAVLIIAAILAATLLTSGPGELHLTTTNHLVVRGETVWEIASAYMDKQDKTRDVRELMWDIKEANKLKNYIIHPGDVVVIPLWKK